MRIAIIGAGIAGVTTAYELATDGHEVCVFERRGSVAAEGSFANSATVVPGLALPLTQTSWPAPGAAFRWRMKQWKAARQPEADARADRVLHLAVYAQTRLQTLRRHMQLDYERADGALLLLRSEREREAIQPGLARLERAGLPFQSLDTAQCRAHEPGLDEGAALIGGIELKAGEVGNCRQFAMLLRQEAQRHGVRWRFDTTVRSIEANGQLVHEHVPTVTLTSNSTRPVDAGDTEPAPLGPVSERFDAIVACAALQTAELLKPLSYKLPLHGLTTHAITVPLRQLEAHPDLGPRAALLDVQQQVLISRIGQRVRLVGRDEAQLHKVLHDWFPGAAQTSQTLRWSGEQAVLPDALPLLGASGVPGLWLNTAHGDAGWTLACGAARVLADQLAGRTPEVDVAGLDLGRLR